METTGSEIVIKVSPSSPSTEDVMIEILSRSPVKLVLRSRCVSKDWYSLTTSPHFISLHRNKLECLHPNLSLILHGDYNPDSKYGFSLLCDEETVSNLDLPNFMLNREIKAVRIVGSSNGLVCLSVLEFVADYRDIQRDIIVWNLTTKQFQYLPEPEPVFPDFSDSDNFDPMLGFGFIDDMISGYRLVRIFRNFTHEDRSRRAQVLTQGANFWREIIGGISCEESDPSSCSWTWMTVNAVMYCLACDESSVFKYLFSFNLRDEVFNLIPPLPSDVRVKCNIFSWKNSLAMFSWCRTQVWVLTDESAERRWRKQFTLSSSVPGLTYMFVGVWKDQFLYSDVKNVDGNLDWQGLFLYDPTSKEERKLSKVEGKDYCNAIDYVESIAPV